MQFAFFVEWEQIAPSEVAHAPVSALTLVSSGKRQTIYPALAQDGKPYMVIGTPAPTRSRAGQPHP